MADKPRTDFVEARRYSLTAQQRIRIDQHLRGAERVPLIEGVPHELLARLFSNLSSAECPVLLGAVFVEPGLGPRGYQEPAEASAHRAIMDLLVAHGLVDVEIDAVRILLSPLDPDPVN